MKNQASFAWKANSEGLNKKNNTFQLNHNSELLDENGFYFRATLLERLLCGTQRSEKVKPFPSTIVLLSFNEKTISVNNNCF